MHVTQATPTSVSNGLMGLQQLHLIQKVSLLINRFKGIWQLQFFFNPHESLKTCYWADV